MNEEMRGARAGSNMLGIEGSDWDIGHAVRFLAGPTARWITGVVVPVDAGVIATMPLRAPKPNEPSDACSSANAMIASSLQLKPHPIAEEDRPGGERQGM